MNSVFVSYAHEDQQRIRPLVTALEQMGLSVFWDRNVRPGENWYERIEQALASAQCVIVAWSKRSVTASFVREEAEDGKQRGILVPALLDSLDSLVRLPLGFREIQAADLTDLREGSPSAKLVDLLKDVDAVIRSSSARVTNRSAVAAVTPENRNRRGCVPQREPRGWPVLRRKNSRPTRDFCACQVRFSFCRAAQDNRQPAND
jgi:formylglycine-generating enzyme